MTPTPAPRGNPFPRVAVASSGRRDLPNVKSRAQRQAADRVLVYSSQFVRGANPGLVLGIRGRVGSGKTHAALQVEKTLRELLPSSHTIYSKTLSSSSFADFFAEVFPGSLQRQDFRNLFSLHLLKLLKVRLEPSPRAEPLTDVVVREAEKRLAEGDPEFVLAALQADLIPSAQLVRELDAELSPAQQVSEELAQAYCQLLSPPPLGDAALMWLKGREITDQQKRDLGLHSTKLEESNLRLACEFLLDAYRRADVALMVTLDEFERFVLNQDDELDLAGKDLLKDIAELFLASGHVLTISGLDQAWDQLSHDALGRVRPDAVEMLLKEDEAEELLHGWERATPSFFTNAASTTLYEVSEFNARRLLEVAHHAWQAATDAGSDQVRPAHVRRAVSLAIGDGRRRSLAIEAAQRVAAGAGLVPPPAVLFKSYDLTLGTTDTPVAFVKVTASVFKDDEVNDVEELLRARREVLRRFPTASTCTIVAGYATQGVLEDLQLSGDTVIRYDEKTFDTLFGAFIGRAKTPQTSSVTDDKYEELLKRFAMTAAQSRAEVDQVRESLSAINERHDSDTRRRVAASSAAEILVVLDRLTDLLKQEEELWARGDGDDRRSLKDILHEQRSLVRQGRFLDRLTPHCELEPYFERYAVGLEASADILSGKTGPSSGGLDARLRALREMRRVATTAQTWRGWARRSLTVARVCASIAAITAVAYTFMFVTAVYQTNRAIKNYQAALEDVSATVGRNVVPATADLQPVQKAYSEARTALRASPIEISTTQTVTDTLSRLTAILSCLERVTTEPVDCAGSLVAERNVSDAVTREVERVRPASLISLAIRYLDNTLFIPAAILVLLAPMLATLARQYLRRLNRPATKE
jgi:hypothetical protein